MPLRIGGAADVHHRDAAREPRHALPEPLAIPVGVGLAGAFLQPRHVRAYRLGATAAARDRGGRGVHDHALRTADARYTVESHQTSHGVTYETARTDLQSLSALGLIVRGKSGRRFVYRPAPGLAAKLAAQPKK